MAQFKICATHFSVWIALGLRSKADKSGGDADMEMEKEVENSFVQLAVKSF